MAIRETGNFGESEKTLPDKKSESVDRVECTSDKAFQPYEDPSD